MDTIEVITHFSDILRSDMPDKKRAEYTENDPITSVRISKEWLLDNVPKIAGIPETEVEGWLESATINDTVDIIDEAICDYRASGIYHENVPENYLLWHRDDFPYQMLARLISDCDYYLGAGGYHEKHLWAGNVKDHIAKMKEIYNSFLPADKPDWTSMEDIERYERMMNAPTEFASRMEQIPGYGEVTPQAAQNRFSLLLPNDFLMEEKASIAYGESDDYAVGWAHSEILLGYHIDLDEWEEVRHDLSKAGLSAINCFEKRESEQEKVLHILEKKAPDLESRMRVRPWAKAEAHNIYIRQKAIERRAKGKTR